MSIHHKDLLASSRGAWEDAAQVSPKQLLTMAWKWKGTLLASFVACNVAAWAVFTSITPTYESSSFLIAQADRRPQIGDNSQSQSILRQDQFLNTQAEIIQSETVLRDAIKQIGAERLYAATEPPTSVVDLLTVASSTVNTWLKTSERPKSPADQAYERVAKLISVRVEPLTDLIRVSFRHRDPKIAAEFVQQVMNSFLSRQSQLAANSSAVKFVDMQKQRYSAEFERASSELSEYSRRNAVFSIEKQRDLLLSQRSNLLTSLASTRGQISEKEAQVRELAKQLTTLKLTNISPQIAALAKESQASRGQSDQKDVTSDVKNSDPPLLLVRVYQDTVQMLVRTNVDLAGLNSLSVRQQAELEAIGRDLETLSAKETEYSRLKQNLDVASHSSELFARKAVEQEVDAAALSAQQFSKLQVAQDATVPTRPSSPKAVVFLAVGVLAGLFSISAIMLLLTSLSTRRRVGPGHHGAELMRHGGMRGAA
ncbi:GumC family protein [Microvirga sesbaniae]|uniref:GumC family protein n=1 Tax=Microvirga sesbaniae TaxID=681392 RepID=UPI0021C954F8|nr:Wzz/FepE/Etk N-terminal domain-containing protein [Microvirga sp. HBU67692]